MVSLDSYKKGGTTYWRIVESKRVNGKPRPIPILHLGTADALLQRLLESPQGKLSLRSYEHGPVAALKSIADRLGIATLIDQHVPTTRHGLSVGTTLLLTILNRAIHPRSKRAFASWAETTTLHRLVPKLQPQTLTSQYFWDQMDLVPEEALEAIEAELARRVVQQQGLTLDTLFYDSTNFFTYIATTNQRNHLAQRGKSKQKRSDLRQVSVALLVSRDGQIPLVSKTYEGNRPDAVQFPESLTLIRQRLESILGSVQDVTIVYDRGNNSKKNQALVDEADVGYVAALVPTQHADLLSIPVEQYEAVSKGPLEGVLVHRTQRTLWGAERTLVLYVSERLRQGQIRGLEQALRKKVKELNAWKAELSNPQAGPNSPESVQRKVQSLLSGQYVKQVLRVEYDASKEGAERLAWWIDEEARARLERDVFGKRFLMTNRHEWTSEQVIEAYHGQYRVEAAFSSLKNPDCISLRPQYHWTDQKIRVHVFTCVTALLLTRVLEWEARRAKFMKEAPGLLEDLARVRLAMVLRSAGPKGGRPRVEWVLEQAPREVMRLFRLFVPPGAGEV